MGVRILVGDCRDRLREIADASVQCVVTSPPYFGLRDYGHEGQIGLEPTPDEFVAAMVEVFREVRRVLRDDGTLWLNLGDSYAANRSYQVPSTKGGPKHSISQAAGGKGAVVPDGLKQKDLIGIPWAVATALRAPYYTGRIKDERDRIWLAAMIDAEGCMFIHKRKAGTGNHSAYTKKDGTVSHYSRTQDTYGAGLEVANTSEAVVARCQQITGVGSICRQDKDRRQPLYRWNVRSNECRWIVEEVYPYLVAKQHQARLLLGCPSSGKDAERAHGGLIALHNGSETDIDFKPPAPLFQPGFYLRQDLIWSKLNPMPESVRDRCTKAHEYIFLLTKSPRYFFDQEAIKEQQVTGKGAKYYGTEAKHGYNAASGNHRDKSGSYGDGKTRNRRSVWTVTTKPFKGAHFATFPPDLIEPCILAGTSAKGVCPHCAAPWTRETERQSVEWDGSKYGEAYLNGTGGALKGGTAKSTLGSPNGKLTGKMETTGWSPSCACPDNEPVPATILDPFFGSGTTGLVADELGRDCIGIELNPEYADMARRRIERDGGMFSQVEIAA